MITGNVVYLYMIDTRNVVSPNDPESHGSIGRIMIQSSKYAYWSVNSAGLPIKVGQRTAILLMCLINYSTSLYPVVQMPIPNFFQQ